MRRHVLACDNEAGVRPYALQPKRRYESIVLVFFLCILFVVTVVKIMDYTSMTLRLGVSRRT